MPRPCPTAIAAALLTALALALAGCGTSGYGTVNTHQLVLIPTAGEARATAALACGARLEAHRLHHALRVARPRSPSASSQIAVVNAVTNDKPGGVLIVPVERNAMFAPMLSMRRAGIRVARLSPPGHPATAAAQAARAVAAVVGAIGRHGDRGTRVATPVNLLARCGSVH